MSDDSQQPAAAAAPVLPVQQVSEAVVIPAVPAPGDDEVKNVLNFLFQLAGQVESIVKKGSVSLFDLPGFYGAFKAAGPALANVKNLWPQIEGLNEAEIEDLEAYVKANLSVAVPDSGIQDLVTEGIQLAEALYSFVKKVKG